MNISGSGAHSQGEKSRGKLVYKIRCKYLFEYKNDKHSDS